jgi:hypothetical protein
MPMSPRLLRPIANNIDPDAAIYLNAVAVEDQQQLEPAVRKAINDFVVGCKRDGIWGAIKASCILAGARTLSGALVPLKGAAPTNSGPFVSGDYDRKTGLIGNGTSKHLSSNRNHADDPQDSYHMAVYVTDAPTSGTRMHMGAGTSAGGSSQIFRSTADMVFRFRNNAVTTIASSGGSVGLIAANRSNSSNFTRRISGSSASVNVASQTPLNETVGVFTTFVSGAANFRSDGRLAFYSIGESLDLALLDARVSTLVTAIGAAI